jgi:hypothetical protein
MKAKSFPSPTLRPNTVIKDEAIPSLLSKAKAADFCDEVM